MGPASDAPIDLDSWEEAASADISFEPVAASGPSQPLKQLRTRGRNGPYSPGVGEAADGFDEPGERSSATAPSVAAPAASSRPRKLGPGGMVPIVPHVTLAFHNLASKGHKKFASPVASLPQQPQEKPQAFAAAARGGTIVWVRHFDMRIHDNPALSYACSKGVPVHIVFAWSDAEDAAEGDWRIAGTAAGLWIHHALAGLNQALRQKYGTGLVIRTGETTGAALAACAAECGADEVVTSVAFEPVGVRQDTSAKSVLSAAGVKLRYFQSFLLYDIREVKVDMGSWKGHFGTLTPFHAACSSKGEPPKPLPDPRSLTRPAQHLRCQGLEALRLCPLPVRADGSLVDWEAPILASWDISEAAALGALKRFLAPGAGFSRYEKERNLADASGVARISPYLRFGMLSCRLMHWEIKAAGGRHTSVTFWRRLTWRDLAYWQLLHFPKMREVPVRAHYAGQAWNHSKEALTLWQKGQTGFPLVDAGLRELWATGWMAQNVRMAAAVVLCELLNINWVEGEKWFHHTLVDADPAINAMMWQNAGKGGLDQWNFTMHPVRAGRGQDPNGAYVKKWCPELARLPVKFLFGPFEAPEPVRASAGVTLGRGGCYPMPIVKDIGAACRASADAIREQRKRSLAWNDAGGYDLILIPKGSTVGNDGQKFRIFTKKDWRLPSGGSSWSGGGWNQGEWDEDTWQDGEFEEGNGWWAPEASSQQRARGATGRGGGHSAPRSAGTGHGRGGQTSTSHATGDKSGQTRGTPGFHSVLGEYVQKALGG